MGRIDSAGRVVIPATFRKHLGLEPGAEVSLVLEEGSLRVMSTAEAIRRAQRIVQQYVPADRELASELIADRRREAEDE